MTGNYLAEKEVGASYSNRFVCIPGRSPIPARVGHAEALDLGVADGPPWSGPPRGGNLHRQVRAA